MKLHQYALTAVFLAALLGYVLSQPVETPVAAAPEIIPDTVDVSRSTSDAEFVLSTEPILSDPVADVAASDFGTESLFVSPEPELLHTSNQARLSALGAQPSEDGGGSATSLFVTTDTFSGPVGIATLLKEARERGDTADEVDALLKEAAASGQLLRAPTSTETPERRYIVGPGDSLASIAEEHYGTRDDYLKIYNANRDVLTTPDIIRLGQELRLP